MWSRLSALFKHWINTQVSWFLNAHWTRPGNVREILIPGFSTFICQKVCSSCKNLHSINWAVLQNSRMFLSRLYGVCLLCRNFAWYPHIIYTCIYTRMKVYTCLPKVEGTFSSLWFPAQEEIQPRRIGQHTWSTYFQNVNTYFDDLHES